MREEIERQVQRAIALRREVLLQIPHAERVVLLEQILRDFLVELRRTLLRWAALTGQPAQVDTGYIAQHFASIVLGEPGQGFRGKGLDLADGSEVKSAAIVSGVDRPRWNHDMGTPAGDAARKTRSLTPKWQVYLAAPSIFYFLFDSVFASDGGDAGSVLRVRAWCVDSGKDDAWRELVVRFVERRSAAQYNLQLHPPVGYDDDIVVNTLGNLDMSEVKILDVRLTGWRVDELDIHWVQAPEANVRPVAGRCTALPYGGRGARPSRLNEAGQLEPDIESIRALIPDLDIEALRGAVGADSRAQLEELESEPGETS